MVLNKIIELRNLKLVSYDKALQIQTDLFQNIVKNKIANRELLPHLQKNTNNYLIICEHPHVYTLGKSGKEENLLVSVNKLKVDKIEYFHIGRGGDITYHGPGQMVAYPILDLDNFFTDIHLYLRKLEECIILTLQFFGIEAGRIEGLTGVWVDYQLQLRPRKICAFGVKMSRWVTMHGLALNVNTDLDYFDNIVPCGITGKEVTSMAKELGKSVDKTKVEEIFVQQFTKLFESSIQ